MWLYLEVLIFFVSMGKKKPLRNLHNPTVN